MFEGVAVVCEGDLGEQVVEAFFMDDQTAVAVVKTVSKCRKADITPLNRTLG